MATIRFHNSSYQTTGDLPVVGSGAPELSLVNTRLQDVTLAQWNGQRKILNVFVSVDTETCARSIKAFDARAQELDDVVMLMISADLPFAFSRFFDAHGLEHVEGLSALRNAGFAENYGVGITDGPLEGLFARAVIVLDENNTVVHSELVEELADEPDYRSVLHSLGIDAEGSETS